MRFRRFLSCALTGIILVSLAACGKNNETSGTTTADYIISDNVWAFLSNNEIKFVSQDENFVKVYDKEKMDESGTIITVDPSVTHQTIEGFGASFTDSSKLILSEMSEEKINEAMVNLFDDEKGIGLSIIRCPIGANDFSTYYYTYDDMPDGEEDWNLEHFDSTEAQKQVDLVTKAMNVNSDIKLFLSPWTAPPWMKTGKDYTGEAGGTLRRDCYDVYADYLVKSIQIYEDANLPVYAISPQNEMYLPATWPGMTWDWETMSNFVNDNLRPALTDAGLETKILNMDHNWAYWDRANQMMGATYNTADGVAYHWYNGQPEDMLNTSKYFPDKLLYVTEATNTRPVNTSSFLKITSTIARSLRSDANGYLMWNYALNSVGGPAVEETLANNNAPIITCYPETDEIVYEGDYYALAHFSKYMHQGAVRVESTDTGADNEYKLVNVVVLNPNGTMTAVIVNSNKEAQTCKLVMGDRVMEVTVDERSTVTLTWDANNY